MTTIRTIQLLFLILTAATFTACGQNLGPYSIELKPTRNLELRATDGQALQLAADSTIPATARFEARKKLILLEIGDETAAFAGARLNRTSRDVSAPAQKTGQDLGLQVTLTELWQTRHTRRETRSCLINDGNRPGPILSGTQWVDVHEITRQYQVHASIRDRSAIEVATAAGLHLEKSEEMHPISPCL